MLDSSFIYIIFFFNRGLGVEKVFLRFMRLYCDPQNLVLVVNTTNAEEVSYAPI